eukprot:TRINITY_DN11942_c0_g1_i3.p1 TRINITY_DN11942_c0_g1~~TRINITY_DN11942_c0_g1_i3.p1  ORF type:complete len:523 (+),score=102.89 TRINITY_DN11942_c0_g1_i3:95-1663(+)
MTTTPKYFLAWSLLFSIAPQAWGHGRLIEPPSRSTMWRYGFSTPANYNDHESYCGGFTRQWQTNGGKCGICGDPWDEKKPRANEAGGTYGRGVITRKYKKNQAIKVRIELTANHMGHFEFKMCPQNNLRKPATQTCLDKYTLELANGEGTHYYPGPGNRVFEMWFQLPKDLTCKQCVFQWRYVAANNWGTCKNGTGKVGCGPQEEFRACSDVTITDEDGSANSAPNNDVDVFQKDDTENEINEIENSIGWEHSHSDDNTEQRSAEGIVIIVLASLLTAVLMFGAIFLYYYKARDCVKTVMKERDLRTPKVTFPKLKALKPSRVKSFCKLDKLGKLNWPLSNISLSGKLPSFMNSPVIHLTPPPGPPPIPPPRTKRNKSRCTSPDHQVGPRLATIVPRPHPRVPAPPPSGHPSRPSVPILEISAPTEVTINGVTVSNNSPMSKTAGGPTPSSRGVICGNPVPRTAPATSGMICSAQPALVISDMPDSSMEQSFTFEDIPPPLPSCPPPDSVTNIQFDDSTTDA